MRALFRYAVIVCLMAGSTVNVHASNTDLSGRALAQCNRITELTEQAESEYPSVTKYYQQQLSDRVRARAVYFAKKWPAEVKQQWIMLITARMGTTCPIVDIYDRMFLPPLSYPTSTLRKQRFEVLDTQLTWVLADLLLVPVCLG